MSNPLRSTVAGGVSLVVALGLLAVCGCASARDTHPEQAPSAGSLRTAPAVASHPLDPLTEQEFASLKAILGERGHSTAKTVFGWAQLQEPPKQEVIAFRPGQSFRREAIVVALSPEKKTAHEIVVDLRTQRILSTKDLGNLQPFFLFSEFDNATAAVDASPEVRAALEKRGFTIEGEISEEFWVDLYATGEDPALVQEGRTVRAMRALFANRQNGTNDYGPYVDGLMALVDVYEGKVLLIRDHPGAIATQPVPHDVFDQQTLGPRVPDPKLQIAPRALEHIELEGNHVHWGQWDFRYSFNQREGLVLHQIAYHDAGKLRSICYRAAISEMLVPYSDPSKGWVWREFFDSGEYGLGLLSSEINTGKELPDNAVTLNAVLPTESLDLSTNYPNRVFFYERDGGALFAHTQTSDGSRIYARAEELVIGFLSTVGNYDYLYKWVFRQDGTFGFESELHGEILNRTIEDTACKLCAAQAEDGPGTYVAEGNQRFGTLVSPQILGIYHQHWISLRMDFDIDGSVNAVKEINTKPLPFDAETNSKGRAFTIEQTVFGKEEEAQRNLDPASNRMWVVYNPAVKSPLGHPAGYEVESAGNTISALRPERFGEDTSFTQRHFWVTRYKPDQLYSSGRYPNQAPVGYDDHLFEYAQDNESIYKEDVVLWYSLGFTHITKPEDYPIMPAGKVAVNFSPKGFFEKSPALGHATVERAEP